MKNKIITSLFALALVVAPTVSFADMLIPLGPTASQLLTRVAALQAQVAALQNNQTLACSALFSAPSVTINQPVILAWGSVGAVTPSASSTTSSYPSNGSQTVSIQQPGTWTYDFNFMGANGSNVTCTANITVLGA